VKRIAILQSNYLPWKGYFDLIASVDEFVLYDCVQYTRRDWRNRNKIKAPGGPRWITVPVQVKGRYHQTIDETHLAGEAAWVHKHVAMIRHNYARAGAFAQEFAWFESVLEAAPRTTISALNRHLIEAICRRLGIATRIRSASEFDLAEDRNERLLQICRQSGAGEYVSGPAAKAYLGEALLGRHGITVRWKSYAGYPEYEQPHPPFEHRVSIIDTLLCTGSEARRYISSAQAFEA
jgi:hypothetical protein